MSNEAKQEEGKKNASFLDFWNKNISAWQKTMSEFFEQGTKDNFFAAYRDICSDTFGKAFETGTGSPVFDTYRRMMDAANLYSNMLKSFAVFDVDGGAKATENISAFLDNWVNVQKNLFSQLFGGSLPAGFMQGGNLGSVLGSAFESYKNSLKDMASYYPQDLKPLIENYMNVLEKTGEAFQGIVDPSKFGEFHDSWQKAYDDLFGKFLQAPTVGPSRQFVEKLKKDADSFFKYINSSAEFYSTLYKPGIEAIEETAEQATELFKDLTPDSFRKFYDNLLKSLEMKFFELFKSKGFGEAMKENLNASLEFRTRHTEMIETMLKETPLVTHTEMDEVHEEVYKLKKRIKELEKTIKELKADKSK
ncbi:MAG: hypothetical protein E3J72_18840 [Planctomycetota bacterium]|nr:MAG: hypothetical protein E3J72_18840 [Planctomycetota bacterium]